ncbi:hypothetical protein DDT91_08195 [Algoriphagus sp. AK58]|nr:hypothetical protein [Algoriphagus sp. AK58]
MNPKSKKKVKEASVARYTLVLQHFIGISKENILFRTIINNRFFAVFLYLSDYQYLKSKKDFKSYSFRFFLKQIGRKKQRPCLAQAKNIPTFAFRKIMVAWPSG